MVGRSRWVVTDLVVNGGSAGVSRGNVDVLHTREAERRPHLLRDGAITVLLQSVQLVSLPQQRVEGLGRAVDRGGVGGDGEGRHQTHLLQGGVTARRPVQKLAVLQILRQALQHRQRLVEVHLEKEGSS